jgi:hypothetical protein
MGSWWLGAASFLNATQRAPEMATRSASSADVSPTRLSADVTVPSWQDPLPALVASQPQYGTDAATPAAGRQEDAQKPAAAADTLNLDTSGNRPTTAGHAVPFAPAFSQRAAQADGLTGSGSASLVNRPALAMPAATGISPVAPPGSTLPANLLDQILASARSAAPATSTSTATQAAAPPTPAAPSTSPQTQALPPRPRAATKASIPASVDGAVPAPSISSDRPPETPPPVTGTWTALAHLAPSSDGIGTMMLLSDGTVMAEGGQVDKTWYRLTPDASGSYINGTWSTLPSMHQTRLYYGSNVLPDGRVYVGGGEYSDAGGETNTAEIYDPVANSWTNLPRYPQNNLGDDPSMVLPNGTVIHGYNQGTQAHIYNPSTNSWSPTGSKLENDTSSEETWVKLPDNSILSYNICVFDPSGCTRGHTQRYVPSSGTWVPAGTAPNNLTSSGVGYEMGPNLLLPDGRVFQLGATNHTAFYTPATDTWAAGPDIPNNLGADDAPAAMLPNGKILFSADHPLFGAPTTVFEFDPATNTYTNVTPSIPGLTTTGPCYTDRMLMLPTGQVLFTTSATTGQLAVYTPDGSPNSSWQPTITGIEQNSENTFTLTGTQLNGLSQGASYGDDAEMDTNYPIVRITDAAGTVYYARTFNWSSTGVATGDTPVTTQFTLPSGVVLGKPYTLSVIANGIASDPIPFGQVAGPAVLRNSPSGDTFGSVDHVRMTFDEEINPATFTPDKVVSFVGPTGHVIGITDVQPVDGSGNKQFDVFFPAQRTLGTYTMVIGPDIEDTDGNPMDQNFNGIPGEVPDDEYVARFTIQGPKITASTPSGNSLPGTLTSLRVTFNEPMDPTTFTKDKIASFTRTAATTTDLRAALTTVTPVAGSNNTQFDIGFTNQTTTGTYRMVIGPDIRDLDGHKMDQNGNFIEGEVPGDQYTATFGILGPRITTSALNVSNPLPGQANRLRVTFNEPMDPGSFTPRTVIFIGPQALIPINQITPVAGSNNTQFDIQFDPLVKAGSYQMIIGPHIRDRFGNEMDQNQNLIPGEVPGDEYVTTFGILGPRITTSTPFGGVAPQSVNNVQVTFSEAMDPASFTPDKVASFTRTNGTEVTDLKGTITSIVPIAGSNNTRFSINFTGTGATGRYILIIGPDIDDMFGNEMDQNQNGIPGEIPGDQYTATFTLLGPRIISQTPSGSIAPQLVSSVQLTFNEAMNPASFTRDQVVSFTRTNGTQVTHLEDTITSIVPIAGSNNTRFSINFAGTGIIGQYTMIIGPHIRDTFGNEMDQNNNLILGEDPGDRYTATFILLGPRVNSSSPSGVISGQVSSVRVVFNEPMDLATFTPDKLSFTGPNGPIDVTGIFPAGSNQFDITFAPQVKTGRYTLVIGPDIEDYFGNEMDQDNNLIGGEVPGDQYTATFGIAGPRILSSTPTGNANPPGTIDHVRVTFNESMDPTTFTPDKVASFKGPGGVDIPVTGVTPVPFTGDTQFDISCDPLGTAGTYTVVVGPDIHDLFGNAMDQNQNLIPGEVPGDQYTTTFGVVGPSITASRPLGNTAGLLSGLRVTFSEPMNPATFTPDKVASFQGPQGPINVSDVVAVDGSNNTQFDVLFDPQSSPGTYTMVIGPDIEDPFGNAISQYPTSFGFTPSIDHSGGFADHGDLTANGNAAFTGTVARLTPGTQGVFFQAGSVFSNAWVGITQFTTTFTFHMTPGTNPLGNGITFTIEGNGPTALGPNGDGLGYGPDRVDPTHRNKGIRNSVAIKFDLIDNGDGEGPNSTGIFTDGRSPTVREPGLPDSIPDMSVDLQGTDIDLRTGHVFQIDLAYDGSTLTESITDTETGGTFTVAYTVDIPAFVGGNLGYVGFTGATGAIHTAFQDIQTWMFQLGAGTTPGADSHSAEGTGGRTPVPIGISSPNWASISLASAPRTTPVVNGPVPARLPAARVDAFFTSAPEAHRQLAFSSGKAAPMATHVGTDPFTGDLLDGVDLGL